MEELEWMRELNRKFEEKELRKKKLAEDAKRVDYGGAEKAFIEMPIYITSKMRKKFSK
jgi:hypothetical protein